MLAAALRLARIRIALKGSRLSVLVLAFGRELSHE